MSLLDLVSLYMTNILQSHPIQIHRQRYEQLPINGRPTIGQQFRPVLPSGSRLGRVGCIGRRHWRRLARQLHTIVDRRRVIGGRVGCRRWAARPTAIPMDGAHRW